MTKQEHSALTEIDKPRYRYWQALYLSFFSDSLYVDVAKRWKKLAFGYLLLVLAIAVIPFTIHMAINFNHFFRKELIEPLQRIPQIVVQNGELQFDKPMPYIIKNDSGQVAVVIDKNGTEASKAKFPTLRILINKNSIIYWSPTPTFYFAKEMPPIAEEPFVQSFRPGINDVFDGKKWVKEMGVKRLRILGVATLYPAIFLVFLVLYLMFILVFGLMAQFLAAIIMRMKLSYLETCRLLTVSLTPQIALLFLCLTFNWLFPGLSLVFIILLAFYFGYAVVSVKRASNKLVYH